MICFKKVTKQICDYKSVKELYFSAFPAVERVPFWLLMKKSKNDGADFYAIYDEEKWIGLIYAITDGEVVYVYYYAISEKESPLEHVGGEVRREKRPAALGDYHCPESGISD